MMFPTPSGRLAVLARNFMTSAVRRSGEHHDGGVPGANMPFSFGNQYKLALYYVLFYGSGFAIPFLLLRHQLLKK